ncbi:acyclic terpene utilization AtuA family protein [Actinomadura rifamycini]|uniref:acyclic terpene utilization AtuA family protein n=1 Tax=Actinomadura rifamycini TaxID=31962 RepID=UPI000427E262|nr:acyclic terpene utilization AtuA family protein [Actinomadura rifamycini]
MTDSTPTNTTSMRIGCGAGFAGDRVEPAADLLDRGDLDVLVLECLAERTIALGHRRRLRDPAHGYEPRLRARLAALLPRAARRRVPIVSNMGAANPRAAGEAARDLARELGLDGLRIAVVTGDDVLDRIDLGAPALEDGRPLAEHGPVISANAYLGVDALMPALAAGAGVVLTGRVADPSLFLAPLAHGLGWDPDDLPRVAAGTMTGHLLECAGHLTGGYFADPGRKDVPGLADLGFPFADVDAAGTAEIGKLPGTGGLVSRATVREQLLYEITDPAAYLTPDVVLDLRGVTVEDVRPDVVRVRGAAGRPRPDTLKVSVGYHAGHRAEAEISYAGPNARRRAELAGEIVAERLGRAGVRPRTGVIGTPDGECRLRVAAITPTPERADDVCHEVEALYTNGPAGGGGVRTRTDEVIGIVSTLLPREAVTPATHVLEVSGAHETA